MTQLHDLSKPFPSKFVHTNPSGGGEYVKHHVVDQRLLQISGPFDWEKVEIIRGDVPAIPPKPDGKTARAKAGSPALTNVIVGAVWRITLEIDGRRTVVEASGDCEEPHNWSHDGKRLKDAESDALKRCAMRFGCGLHLWSQDEYFLFTRLSEDEVAAALPPPSVNVETGEISDGGEPTNPPSSHAPPVSHSVSTEATGAETANADEPPDERGVLEPPSNGANDRGAVVTAPPPNPISAAQMRKLQVLFAKLRITDDKEKRKRAGAVLGRTVESLTHLSVKDGIKVIDALESAEMAA